jgi:hypothetical protein
MSSSKRNFKAVIENKEKGTYVSSSPSSAARKAVSKLCADDKKRKVVFSIREITQGSDKKVYGPYIGYMQKLDKPVELQGRVIRYKSVAKMKGGKIIGKGNEGFILQTNLNSKVIDKNDIKYKQKGGIYCINERVFKNILGTCWLISILMMMCFSDATKEQIERELVQPNTTIESIINLDKKLKKILPSKYSDVETTKRIEYLKNLLDAFIKRYISKIERHIPISTNPLENPDRCELVIHNNYISLFNNIRIHKDYFGGNKIDCYFFANLFGIFFLKQEIYFSIYTRKMFNQISFNNQDIGIIIEIDRHMCCFFVCQGLPKFYNDHDKKIYDFDFMNLLKNLKDDEDLFVIPNKVVALNRNEYFKNIKKYYYYKKILCLTAVSKNDFGNNFNQEIKLFFDDEYDEINNFYLLFEIGIKLWIENLDNEAFKFLIKRSNDEYYITMFLLGEFYKKIDIDTAIEYYQKALDNGYNDADILAKLYDNKNKKNWSKIIMYKKFDLYSTFGVSNINSNSNNNN